MSPSIPKKQTAAVVSNAGEKVQVKNDHTVTQPDQLAPGECLVKIEYTGVCHTDLHVKNGDWPVKGTMPLIGGHEGVGSVVAIGANTTNCPVDVGDRVGIKWLADSCLQCESCRKGSEPTCSKAKNSGFSVPGTFQQYVVSYVNHVSPIPKGLDSAEAASVLCAGVTVYRAIKYGQTQVGDWIAIPGAGGGLGHLAIQYAAAKGLRVLAIDTGADKKKLCLDLGADAWIDFKESKDIVQSIKDATDGLGPHSTVITAANSEVYEQAISYLRPNGTLMVVSLPAQGTLKADIFFTVLKSITIVGSYVGNRQDAVEALAIAAAGKVKVHYALKGLSDLQQVYDDLEAGKITGRVVLDVNK